MFIGKLIDYGRYILSAQVVVHTRGRLVLYWLYCSGKYA